MHKYNQQALEHLYRLSRSENGYIYLAHRRKAFFRGYKAVTFDGTNDYMTRGAALTGLADGKEGTCSFWIKLNGGDAGAMSIIEGATNAFWIQRPADNTFRIQAYNAAAGAILVYYSSTTYTAGATWLNVLWSWNQAGTSYLYVNDVNKKTAQTQDNDTIDYDASANWGIGGQSGGGQKLNADLAELWFDDAAINFSVEANRRKFITATGKPAQLLADGSGPGIQPIVYQSVRPGDAATVFATNRGTGGNFSITGTLAIAATSPSD